MSWRPLHAHHILGQDSDEEELMQAGLEDTYHLWWKRPSHEDTGIEADVSCSTSYQDRHHRLSSSGAITNANPKVILPEIREEPPSEESVGSVGSSYTRGIIDAYARAEVREEMVNAGKRARQASAVERV